MCAFLNHYFDWNLVSPTIKLVDKRYYTHSSILAWEIPWMEEPARLQSMGSQRVRLDSSTNTHYKQNCEGIFIMELKHRT